MLIFICMTSQIHPVCLCHVINLRYFLCTVHDKTWHYDITWYYTPRYNMTWEYITRHKTWNYITGHNFLKIKRHDKISLSKNIKDMRGRRRSSRKRYKHCLLQRPLRRDTNAADREDWISLLLISSTSRKSYRNCFLLLLICRSPRKRYRNCFSLLLIFSSSRKGYRNCFSL